MGVRGRGRAYEILQGLAPDLRLFCRQSLKQVLHTSPRQQGTCRSRSIEAGGRPALHRPSC
eukprot:scaffold952_cov249-Pinguiococcus_pyrenoidosus.AAC.30